MATRKRWTGIRALSLVGCFFLWTGWASQVVSSENGALEVFVGSASQPATEEAARRFEEKTGIRLNLHFGGSGKMLSEMKLSERGDLYFPGSSDFMERAKEEGLVLEETEKIVVYLIPAIDYHVKPPFLQTYHRCAFC